MMRFRVFKRTWWKPNPDWPNGREPEAGEKRTLRIVDTEEEARAYCRRWNASHEPGKLALRAEYQQIR